MNLTDLEFALRELRLSGMSRVLEHRLGEPRTAVALSAGGSQTNHHKAAEAVCFAPVAMDGEPASARANLVLSVLVPVYNEEAYVARLLDAVVRAPLPLNMGREIIVVNDASTDGSRKAIQEFAANHPDLFLKVIHKTRNEGKGAAIRTAIDHATGTFCVVQDADLEYDPREYARLLNPLLEGHADAVFGSRFLAAGERRVLYFWHSVANRILTLFCNIASDINLTDMETCYKMVRTELLKTIPLRSNRFGFEPEITIKLAKRAARIYETPISYHGRTYKEGKKIGPRDALWALLSILRFWMSRDVYRNAIAAPHPAAVFPTGSGTSTVGVRDGRRG